MEKLHTDILENILDRLPTAAALAAKQVCQTWRNLLHSKTNQVGLLFVKSYSDENGDKIYCGDYFGIMHGKMKHNYSYHILQEMSAEMYSSDYSYPGYKITDWSNMLGSCNGLVCFQRRESSWYLEEPILICNPVTGEVVHVPKTNSNTYSTVESALKYRSGFGYCHSKNEYKIVRAYTHWKERKKKTRVQVYTIGGDSEWRNKDESIIISESCSVIGTYANGALYWLDLLDWNQKDCSIIALDLEDETLHSIAFSCAEDVQYKGHAKLLGGDNLYLVCTIYEKHCTDIWAYKRKNTNTANGGDLKEHYKDKNLWHWIKEFSIEWEERFWKNVTLFEPIAITRYDELLLIYSCKTLYCYDLKTSRMNNLFNVDKTSVMPHANSIVSMRSKLEDLVEVQDPFVEEVQDRFENTGMDSRTIYHTRTKRLKTKELNF